MKKFDSNFSKIDIPLHGVRLPDFKIEDRIKDSYGLSSKASNYEFLLKVCRENFKKFDIPKEQHAEYGKRVKSELSTIKELGFVDYILLVWTVINHCKETDIAVGLGRGSAAGSLVLYLLGVTKVDP